MSNGYGWQDHDPYAAEDPRARGVYPDRGTGPVYGADQHGGQQYGAPQYGAHQYGGDVRNDYGRAPADTDAGRGGAHKWSIAVILLYFGLPFLVVGVSIVVAVIVAGA
ncbi:MAG: hypothetical protein ACTHXO_07410 [Actinomycetaceae bacterium]